MVNGSSKWLWLSEWKAVVSAGISARFQGHHAHYPSAVHLQAWVAVLAIVRVVHSSSLCCLSGLYLFGQNESYHIAALRSQRYVPCPCLSPVVQPCDPSCAVCCPGDQCNATALLKLLSPRRGLPAVDHLLLPTGAPSRALWTRKLIVPFCRIFAVCHHVHPWPYDHPRRSQPQPQPPRPLSATSSTPRLAPL